MGEAYIPTGGGIIFHKIKDEDVAIPNLSKLLPINRDLAPGRIIKWNRSDVTDFNGLTAYLSIDLDVLIEDCQVDELNPLEIDPKEAGRTSST